MAIIDSYSESTYLADQVLANLTSHPTAISQIPALTSHISFLLCELIFVWPSVGRSTLPCQMSIIDSYSESTYLADQVLANLTSHPTAISQIPALTSHISFLLWEVILGRPGVGRSNPPLNSNFTDSYSDSSYFIPTLRTHIWHTRCWQIYPTIKWQLYIPTLRAHIWQTRCWQIYPPLNGNFTDCCSDSSYFIPTLRTHIWHMRCWQI